MILIMNVIKGWICKEINTWEWYNLAIIIKGIEGWRSGFRDPQRANHHMTAHGSVTHLSDRNHFFFL